MSFFRREGIIITLYTRLTKGFAPNGRKEQLSARLGVKNVVLLLFVYIFICSCSVDVFIGFNIITQ